VPAIHSGVRGETEREAVDKTGYERKKRGCASKKLTNEKKSVRIKEKKRYALKIEARRVSCCVIRRENDSAIE